MIEKKKHKPNQLLIVGYGSWLILLLLTWIFSSEPYGHSWVLIPGWTWLCTGTGVVILLFSAILVLQHRKETIPKIVFVTTFVIIFMFFVMQYYKPEIAQFYICKNQYEAIVGRLQYSDSPRSVSNKEPPYDVISTENTLRIIVSPPVISGDAWYVYDPTGFVMQSNQGRSEWLTHPKWYPLSETIQKRMVKVEHIEGS